MLEDGAAGASGTLTDRLGGVDDLVGELVAQLRLPGAAVVAAAPGGVLASSCHGHADPATGRPWTPATPGRIGSVSKTVTTLALLRHVDAGRLDLDAPVAALLAEALGLQHGVDPRLRRIGLTFWR